METAFDSGQKHAHGLPTAPDADAHERMYPNRNSRGEPLVRGLSHRVNGTVCTHSRFPYAGDIPCTGPRLCTMCGENWDIAKDFIPMEQVPIGSLAAD